MEKIKIKIYVHEAHSGTSAEEIAKAIVLAGNYIDDDVEMRFSDVNNVISVSITDVDDTIHNGNRYVIHDGNPQEHECDCEGIWNDDGEWECDCEEWECEDDIWEISDDRVAEILENYEIISM